MSDIRVIHEPGGDELDSMGVFDWPIWEKEVFEFPWKYEAQETCYVLEGEVVVTPDGGEAVTIKAGDLAIFPSGMSCRWNVRRPIRKHYSFE